MPKQIKSRKAKATIILFVGAVLAFSYFGFQYLQSNHPSTSSNLKTNDNTVIKPPTTEEKSAQIEADSQQKQSYLDSSTNSGSPATAPTSADTIAITPTTQGEKVILMTKLAGQGYDAGKCDLYVTAAEKKYSAQASIIYQAEYSQCAGFEVPITELGYSSWTITLAVTPVHGQTLTKTITYAPQP